VVPPDWVSRLASRFENVRRASGDYPENLAVRIQCHLELVVVLEELQHGYIWLAGADAEWLDDAFDDLAAYHRLRVFDLGRRQLDEADARAGRPSPRREFSLRRRGRMWPARWRARRPSACSAG